MYHFPHPLPDLHFHWHGELSVYVMGNVVPVLHPRHLANAAEGLVGVTVKSGPPPGIDTEWP